MSSAKKLRIIHCFRAPVGGVFRHVRDLAQAQSDAGHSVGIICDSSTGGAFEDRLFETMKPNLALGLVRIPMRRSISPRDFAALYRTYRHVGSARADVLHAHGAKGGAYARIIGMLLRLTGNRIARLYCPHGGSIHFDAATTKGKAYFALERTLERITERLIFVSAYERDTYCAKIGEPRCPSNLVHNGLAPEEFQTVPLEKGAADFLFIGNLRDLKGPDVFLNALAQVVRCVERPVTAHLVGEGEEKAACLEQIERLDLSSVVQLHDPMPARQAFAMSRVVVVPSRAESLPYIVLEAVAAGRPVIASHVGGIPEILDQESDRLVPPGDPQALAAAMHGAIAMPPTEEHAKARSAKLAERFAVDVMAAEIEKAYRASI